MNRVAAMAVAINAAAKTPSRQGARSSPAPVRSIIVEFKGRSLSLRSGRPIRGSCYSGRALARPGATHCRGDERLREVEQEERRDAKTNRLADRPGVDAQMGDATAKDHRDANARREESASDVLVLRTEGASCPGSDGIGDEVSAGRSDESEDAGSAERREHWQPHRSCREVEDHARRASDRAEHQAGEGDDQRLKRERNWRTGQRNRDLCGRGAPEPEPESA